MLTSISCGVDGFINLSVLLKTSVLPSNNYRSIDNGLNFVINLLNRVLMLTCFTLLLLLNMVQETPYAASIFLPKYFSILFMRNIL